jgi:hypothetical protein
MFGDAFRLDGDQRGVVAQPFDCEELGLERANADEIRKAAADADVVERCQRLPDRGVDGCSGEPLLAGELRVHDSVGILVVGFVREQSPLRVCEDVWFRE